MRCGEDTPTSCLVGHVERKLSSTKYPQKGLCVKSSARGGIASEDAKGYRQIPFGPRYHSAAKFHSRNQFDVINFRQPAIFIGRPLLLVKVVSVERYRAFAGPVSIKSRNCTGRFPRHCRAPPPSCSFRQR